MVKKETIYITWNLLNLSINPHLAKAFRPYCVVVKKVLKNYICNKLVDQIQRQTIRLFMDMQEHDTQLIIQSYVRI